MTPNNNRWLLRSEQNLDQNSSALITFSVYIAREYLTISLWKTEVNATV